MHGAVYCCSYLQLTYQGGVLKPKPLVVDLDGTLILTDMLHESALRAMRYNPLDVVRIPRWLLQGKAVLKQKLAL